MIKNFKTTAATLALIVITVICFTGCNLIPVEISKAESGIDTISEAWDIISREYVESSKINSSNMTRAAISGIIETLDDPYTTYLTPEEFKISQSSISGEFDGIGAVVGERDVRRTGVVRVRDVAALVDQRLEMRQFRVDRRRAAGQRPFVEPAPEAQAAADLEQQARRRRETHPRRDAAGPAGQGFERVRPRRRQVQREPQRGWRGGHDRAGRYRRRQAAAG